MSAVVRPQDSSLIWLRKICHGDNLLYLHNRATGGYLDISFGELVDAPNAVHLLAHQPLEIFVMSNIVCYVFRRLGRQGSRATMLLFLTIQGRRNVLAGPSSDTAPGRTMLRLLKQTLRLFQYIKGWTPDQLLRLLFGHYRG